MTVDELEKLRTHKRLQRLGKLTPDAHPDRTLLYGYDSIGDAWHIYQKDGEIHLLIFGFLLKRGQVCSKILKRYEKSTEFAVATLIPNRRLYPERCDFAFCYRVLDEGFHLPFAPFDEGARKTTKSLFVNLTLEDISDAERFALGEQMQSPVRAKCA